MTASGDAGCAADSDGHTLGIVWGFHVGETDGDGGARGTVIPVTTSLMHWSLAEPPSPTHWSSTSLLCVSSTTPEY
jgi:hypothetical protein